MRIVAAADPHAPALVLAHGAGAGEAHPWMRRVADGLAARGVSVTTFDFPYMRDGSKRPDPGAVLEEAFRSAWTTAIDALGADGARPVAYFAGGKSMGGRIASQAAARALFDPMPRGLVFFGYPLHPPGKPDQRRDRHLPRVSAPMLFLHGTRDPFGSPDEMTTLTDGLAKSSLHLVDGGDHSLVATKRADPSGASLDIALDVAARWIQTLAAN